jgi:hypothetical protein
MRWFRILWSMRVTMGNAKILSPAQIWGFLEASDGIDFSGTESSRSLPMDRGDAALSVLATVEGSARSIAGVPRQGQDDGLERAAGDTLDRALFGHWTGARAGVSAASVRQPLPQGRYCICIAPSIRTGGSFEGEIRSKHGQLQRRLALFGQLSLQLQGAPCGESRLARKLCKNNA